MSGDFEAEAAALLDEIEAVLASTQATAARAGAIQALRQREGRKIGKRTRDALVGIQAGLVELAGLLKELDVADQPDPDLVAEFERFQQLKRRLP